MIEDLENYQPMPIVKVCYYCRKQTLKGTFFRKYNSNIIGKDHKERYVCKEHIKEAKGFKPFSSTLQEGDKNE